MRSWIPKGRKNHPWFTPKLESDREVVNPTRKRKLFALSTDEIVNAVLEIGKLCQSHGVKDIFISSLICRKNNFQNNKVSMINKLLRRACDSLGFHFIYNSSIARNHLAGDGIHLNYAGTEVLLENIAFCLNNFLWNKASKNTEPFDQHFSIKHIDKGNGNYSKTDRCDTVEHWNELRLKNINKLVIFHLNINSPSNKFDQLKLIIKNKVDILVITETKLDSSFPDSHWWL